MAWWRMVVAALLVGSLAAEASAFSLGNAQNALEGAPADGPPLPPDLILPSHLTGGFPRPLPPGIETQHLPTLRDLQTISPAYAAPPPQRSRRR